MDIVKACQSCLLLLLRVQQSETWHSASLVERLIYLLLLQDSTYQVHAQQPFEVGCGQFTSDPAANNAEGQCRPAAGHCEDSS